MGVGTGRRPGSSSGGFIVLVSFLSFSYLQLKNVGRVLGVRDGSSLASLAALLYRLCFVASPCCRFLPFLACPLFSSLSLSYSLLSVVADGFSVVLVGVLGCFALLKFFVAFFHRPPCFAIVWVVSIRLVASAFFDRLVVALSFILAFEVLSSSSW